MRTRSCTKCQGTMTEGFVVSEKGGMKAVSSWWQGPPHKTWLGLKLKGKPVEIVTWRCQRCGFLENYAPV